MTRESQCMPASMTSDRCSLSNQLDAQASLKSRHLRSERHPFPFASLRSTCQCYVVQKGSPSSYYAVKKKNVNFFAKFFEVFAKFFKVFASCLRFSRAFRGFRIHSDPLGCIRMHSEAIGSVWTFSKIFEIFWIFESFFNVSGRNFYKRLFSRHNMSSFTEKEVHKGIQ